MKRIKIIAILALIVFVESSCEEEKVDFDRYGSLSGTVVDGESYLPLKGVLVSTNPASSSVITSDDGTFEFSKVLTGEVTITARKNDYLTQNVLVSVYEDEQTSLNMYLVEDEDDYGSVTIYDPVPGNGAVDQLSSFTMKWNVDQSKSSIDLTYDVYLFRSNSTTQILVGEGVDVEEVIVDDLVDNTTYYWYVVAKYNGDVVANGPTWSFKTGDNSSS